MSFEFIFVKLCERARRIYAFLKLYVTISQGLIQVQSGGPTTACFVMNDLISKLRTDCDRVDVCHTLWHSGTPTAHRSPFASQTHKRTRHRTISWLDYCAPWSHSQTPAATAYSVVASVKRIQHILFVKPTFKIRAHQWNDPQDLSAKGGGFWFHKPVLLRHHLDLYSEGELLALADVDRMDFSN
jgi:hypothetical protein